MYSIKKNMKKIYMMTVTMLIITLLPPAAVQASVKSSVSNFVSVLDKFVYFNIDVHFWYVAESEKAKSNYTVKMDSQNMLTAAALSTKYDNNEIMEAENMFGDGYVIYKLSSKTLEKRCKNLFGKTASVSDLDYKKKQRQLWSLFQKSGHPCLCCITTETDTDLIRNSLSIKKTANGVYTVKEKMYFGHWLIDKKRAVPNYVVTFKIKKNKASSYGYVVKSMKIKRIGKTWGG